MRLTVLGCGPSSGIPSVTGHWGQCVPSQPKNCRLRTSLSIHTDDGEVWLIDAGPDLRMQLMRERIQRVHGVFLTHTHADHILGLDELRPMFGAYRQPIPFYADHETHVAVEKMFGYLISKPSAKARLPIYTPFLVPHVLEPEFCWKGIQVKTFVQDHGGSTTIGYRFENWAYSTDVKTLSEEALSLLEGVETWFVDCIALEEKPTHAHLEQTLAWIQRVKPKRAILIHMGSGLDYDVLKSRLPQGVEPAYDGLTVDC